MMPAMESKSARRSAQSAKARPSRPKAGLPGRPRPLLPLAGFLAACLLPLLLPVDWFHPRLWKGYYTVFLRSAAGARPEFPTPAVSRYTSRVSFNTFGGLASVRVADLSVRLDSADPRQDPFLRGVEGYFRGPAGEVLYARSPRGPLLWGLGSLGPDRRVLELDPVAAMIRLLLLAAGALLVLLPARLPNVPRWLLGLGLLPWALGVATGDLRDLLSFLLLFPFWIRAMVWAAARQLRAGRDAARGGLEVATRRRRQAAQAGQARTGQETGPGLAAGGPGSRSGGAGRAHVSGA